MNAGVSARLAAYIDCFESLAPDSLWRMEGLFAEDASFRDPFNAVRGRAAIRRVFAHMFAVAGQPRFVVTDAVEQEDVAYLRWSFTCLLRGQGLALEGVSRVCFDRNGLVLEHVDYWDPAEGIYARLPVIGGVLRWLRRRMGA